MRHIALIVLWFALSASAGEPLPAQFVGVWATADSVFNGLVLHGGTALYLDVDGKGALVGAPLPVRQCDDQPCAPRIGIPLRATATDSGILAVLTDGKNTKEILFAFEAPSKILLFSQGPNQTLRLVRREAELPPAMRGELNRIASLQGTRQP